jgi:uncharacterized protein (TIGR03067 family)
MRRLLFTAALWLSGAAVAHAADDAPALKGDLDRLQGTWVAKFREDKDTPFLTTIVVTFKDNTVFMKTRPGDAAVVEERFEFRIDETARPRKMVDWIRKKNSNDEAMPESYGIYEFVDADTVRFCSGGPGKYRPTEFKGGEGNTPPHLVTIKRQNDKPKPKDGALTGDLLKLQGKWTVHYGPEQVPFSMTIKGRQVERSFTSREGVESHPKKGEIIINDAAKPKTMDLVRFTLNGEEMPPTLGIYTLSGDQLTIRFGTPGGDRPTAFDAAEASPPVVLEYKRQD